MSSREALRQLRSDEGMSRKAEFIQKEKHRTVGHGFSLGREDSREQLLLAGVAPQDIDSLMAGELAITDEQADALFQQSLAGAESDALSLVPGLREAPQGIQDVLVNMSYQLGKTSLRGFKRAIKAANEGDWGTLRKEMLDSKWARSDTPNRAKRLAAQVSTVVKQEPKPAPKGAIAQKVSAEAILKEETFNAQADELAALFHQDFLEQNLADLISNNNLLDQPETATPANTSLPERTEAKTATIEGQT